MELNTDYSAQCSRRHRVGAKGYPIPRMSECMGVYVIDNAYTKIVHHFREAHHQMKLERMRCKSDRRREKQDITAQQRGKN